MTPARKFTAAQQNAPHRFAAVLFIILVLGLFSEMRTSVANVYVSQFGAGAQTGLDCTTAKPVTFFNNGANWGGGGAQIGPDTFVHLCGTFTGAFNTIMLTIQGGGTSGHPVTILFEPGAVLTSPAWSQSGAINCQGHPFITIDGGGGSQPFYGAPTNGGVIIDTDNGTNLGHHIDAFAISADAGCSDFTVKNLNIQQMYVRVALSPAISGEEGAGISTFGSNTLITHNTLDHARTAIGWAYCNGASNFEASYNAETFVEHGVTVGSSNVPCNASGVNIHHNDIGGGAYLWDTATNDYHHDPIHVFNSGGVIAAVQVHDNYIHGVWGQDQAYFNATGGTHITAFIFIEAIGDNGLIYNNYINTSGGNGLNFGDNGTIEIKTAGTPGQNSRNVKIYSNTLTTDSPRGKCIELDAPGAVLIDTICNGWQYAVYTPGWTAPYTNRVMPNNNDYFGASNWGDFDAFASWQAKVTDAGSILGNPNLNSTTGAPGPGSAALGAGANLTSLGIPGLATDFNNQPRPTLGPWTIGAIQGATSGNPLICFSLTPTITFPSTTQFTNSAPITETVTNCGNANLVLANNPVNNSGTNGTDFIISAGTTCTSLATITPGNSCVVNEIFHPTNTGTRTGILGISGNAVGSVGLSGVGTAAATAAVTVTPSPFNFGNQNVGTPSGVQLFNITNTGTANLVLGPSFLGFSLGDYARSGGTPGTCANNGTVTPGGFCTVGVIFTPAAVGARNATLTISGNVNGTGVLQGAGTSAGTAAFTLTPLTFNYGNVRKGTTSALHNFAVTSVGGAALLLNSTSFYTISNGSNPTDFARVSPGGSDCINGHSYNPGDPACLISIAFTPSTAGAENTVLSINANVSGPTAALSGTGIFPALTVTPPQPINFGSINQGSSSAAVLITVTNSGSDTEHFANPAVTVTGDFSISSRTCNDSGTVAAAGNCTISPIFTPTTAGTRTGVITVHGLAGDVSTTINLTGVGVATAPRITITPRPVQFPGTNVGSTSIAVQATVTNSGNATETISATSVVGEFAIVGGGTCGGTLAASSSCFYNLTFSPAGVGIRNGTFTVTGTSSDTVQLTGQGVPVGPLPAPIPFMLGVTLPAGQLRCVKTGSRCNPITLQVTGKNFLSTTKLTLDGAAITTSCTSVSCSATLPASTVSLPGFSTSPHTISIQ